jgi:Xaa-Pro aminopeptidase
MTPFVYRLFSAGSATMTTHHMTAAERLGALRTALARQNLSGFVIPLTDEHMSEYVGDYAKRLAWLTGFTGSAGSAVVTRDKAAMFTDGRYTLQVRAQVPDALYSYEPVPDTSPAAWLAANTTAGDVIGYDPWYHTRNWVTATRDMLTRQNVSLRAVAQNPVDTVWTDQPAPSLAPIVVHPDQFAGRSSADKRADIAAQLRDRKLDAAIISALDSIAWLFNIRGTDVERTPVPRSFAILSADGTATLFCEPGKVTEDVRAHLGSDVGLQPRAAFIDHIKSLGTAKKTVLFDPDTSVAAVWEALDSAGATIIDGADPCILQKACKNAAELAGTRAAHIRDGAAVSRFIGWVTAKALNGGVDELTAVQKLYDIRAENNLFRDTSFDTISGAGPNGAVIHYRASPETNRPLKKGELFLLDSGGQYLDGTTDITRTMAIGDAGAEEKQRFTRVLKGHIAIATVRFPKGTTGRQLDTLARVALWQQGLDYEHGTGHGVGSYLSVHEGPQRIAKMGSDIELKPGMILSNEPGYYKPGSYGIRIENLIVVREDKRASDEKEMLAFETLTMAPIDRSLVDVSLLTETERAWLNNYHAEVREKLLPQLTDDTRGWLEAATAVI